MRNFYAPDDVNIFIDVAMEKGVPVERCGKIEQCGISTEALIVLWHDNGIIVFRNHINGFMQHFTMEKYTKSKCGEIIAEIEKHRREFSAFLKSK